MAHAAGDANGGLCNQTPGVAASPAPAEVVQRPPHGPLFKQVGQGLCNPQVSHSATAMEGQRILTAWCSSWFSPSEARSGYNKGLTWLGGGVRSANTMSTISTIVS